MPKITIKQHDITDCGATCLASVFAHYNLQLPIARIRQYASTDKKGTNVFIPGILDSNGNAIQLKNKILLSERKS